MPYANSEAQRQYNREYMQTRRDKPRAAQRAWDAQHPEEALLREAVLLSEKWTRRGEYLLRKISLNKAWYESNKERLSQEAKDKYANDSEHRARIDARNLRYTQTHEEENRAYRQQWWAEHKEEQVQKHAAYYLTNRDTLLAKSLAWSKANPDKKAAYAEQYRANKANAPVNDLTPAQWREIKTLFKNRCAYCGAKPKRLTMDHITPLSKGGSHTAANIVPACKKCNSEKHAGPPLSPVQPVLFTLAPPRPKKERA
jgi:5-methylcytosine-specific restriction endonuclease McrA